MRGNLPRSALLVLGVALAVTIGVFLGTLSRPNTVAGPGVSASPTPFVPTDKLSASPTWAVHSSPAPPSSPSEPSGALVSAKGQVLRPGSHPVAAGAADISCRDLIRPGYTGDCGVVPTAGGRSIWVTESKPVPGLASAANFSHVFSYGTGGWVEELHVGDPQARRFAGIRVVEADLTGDGLPELVFGYRYLGSGGDLGMDIVADVDGVPEVVAHPGDAVHGSAVIRPSGIHQYAAQFPGGAPNCCPPYFLERTIAYRDGAFYVISTKQVPPETVPVSQL